MQCRLAKRPLGTVRTHSHRRHGFGWPTGDNFVFGAVVNSVLSPAFGFLFSLVLGVILSLTACGPSVMTIQQQMRQTIARGDYQAAYESIATEQTQAVYEREGASVLYQVELGTLALAAGQDEVALEQLEQADLLGRYDLYHQGGEKAGLRWVVNEKAADWTMQPYCDLYLNVLRQVAWLRQANLTRAVAESREVMSNAEFLRGFFEQDLRQIEKDNDQGFVYDNPYEQTSEGVFVDSTLGAYLSALIFSQSGDLNARDQAWRQLIDVVETYANAWGVSQTALESVARLEPGDVNSVWIGFAGQSPVIESAGASVSGIAGVVVMPFPDLITKPSRVRRVQVEVKPIDGPDHARNHGAAWELIDLVLVEDLAQAATENFNRTKAAIYTRTLTRLAIKAGLAYALDRTVIREQVSDAGLRDLVRLGVIAAIFASEQPDLRTWSSLPGKAYVATSKLEPGAYQVRFVYETDTGAVFTDWQEHVVADLKLQAAVGYYGR